MVVTNNCLHIEKDEMGYAMKKIFTLFLLGMLLVVIGCSGPIGIGRTNVADMPEWYKSFGEYKNYSPEERIYGKGFAEELLLNAAMANAENRAIANLATQVGVYSKNSNVLKAISQNTATSNSGAQKKKDNTSLTSREAREYSETVINNISEEILRRPKAEIADTWEVKKEGTTLYRSWTIWSVSIEAIETSLLEKMVEDPDFYNAVKQLYTD